MSIGFSSHRRQVTQVNSKKVNLGRRSIACLAFALTTIVSACGGGGGGSSVPAQTPVAPPPPASPPPPPAPVLEGVAPYSAISVDRRFTPLVGPTIDGTEAFLKLNIRAMDGQSLEPVRVLGMPTTQFNVRDDMTGLEGILTFSLSDTPGCTPSDNVNQTYDAILLFDRSNSINDTDPTGQFIAAGLAFADLVSSPDQARVAQFSTNFGVLQYLIGAFSSDSAELRSAIQRLTRPGGETPLWDAMGDTIVAGGFADNATRQNALIVFSDGQDNSSLLRSETIERRAQKYGVTVYSVSLQNDESRELDEVALATDGIVWSTDEATTLPLYAATLSSLLGGDYITCFSEIEMSFEPTNYNAEDVGFGPAKGVKLNFEFEYELNGQSGIARNKISVPAFPGRRIGATPANNVFETDILPVSDLSSCAQVRSDCGNVGGIRVQNSCAQPIVARFCDQNGLCESVALSKSTELSFAPILETLSNATTVAVCPDLIAGSAFLPANRVGNAPDAAYSIWTGGAFQCVYERRFLSERQLSIKPIDVGCFVGAPPN